jgi:hypothetical protein
VSRNEHRPVAPAAVVDGVERHFDHGTVQALRGVSFQADAGSAWR